MKTIFLFDRVSRALEKNIYQKCFTRRINFELLLLQSSQRA